jgi:hypothetical protein
MDNLSMSKSKSKMYLIIFLGVVLLTIVFIAVYRYFFQFNNKLVKEYITDESNKYKDSAEVKKLITEGVQYILKSGDLTNQVLVMAKQNGTEKEQELVYSAVMRCKEFNYLPK